MASACIWLSNTWCPARPRALARYIAVSAARISSSGPWLWSPLIAIPMLTLAKVSDSPRRKGRPSSPWMRSATRVASAGARRESSKTMNSSPARRARVSSGLTQRSMRRASSHRSWSPAACPRLSLTYLNRSTSTKRRPQASSGWRRARARARRRRSRSKVRLGNPVSASKRASRRRCSSAASRSAWAASTVARRALIELPRSESSSRPEASTREDPRVPRSRRACTLAARRSSRESTTLSMRTIMESPKARPTSCKKTVK